MNEDQAGPLTPRLGHLCGQAGKVVITQSAREVELVSLNKAHPDRTLEADDNVWMARVIWASQ